jgi:chemotaxis protein MotB
VEYGDFIKGFLVAAGLGVGAYLWSNHGRTLAIEDAGRHRSAVDACQADLGACNKAKDAEHEAREANEKARAEAASNLDASRQELDAFKADADKRLAVFKSLTEKFHKMIDAGKLQVILRHGRMVVKLPAGVLFASGSADLSKEGKDALHEVATILRQVPDRRFMVAGHTDNVPVVPPSTFKNNLELSTGRALTVAQVLIASGMNAGRLVAAGYGEFEPIRENGTEAGRHENRRIEIVVMPNLTELPAVPAESDAGAADAGK